MKAVDFMDVRNHGFTRVAVVIPPVTVANPKTNMASHLAMLERVYEQGAYYALCPELGLTGYTCGDLFHQRVLLDAAEAALAELVSATCLWDMVVSVGLPFFVDDAVFNVAATFCKGKILSLTPKTYPPEYREFYELRHFARAREARSAVVNVAGQEMVHFGTRILLQGADGRVVIYPTICEDDWVPIPPSTEAALAGATILANLSASNIVIGKSRYRRELVTASSARNQAVHLYASAGFGESTTDMSWDGQGIVAERGFVLVESKRFQLHGTSIIADVDMETLVMERARQSSFRQNAVDNALHHWNRVPCHEEPPAPEPEFPRRFWSLEREVSSTPFVPGNPAERDERCEEVFNIQATGLATRLLSLPVLMRRVIIAISGGQDSTHALGVAVKAMDMLKLPRHNVIALTMPGFGTSYQTYRNACALIKSTGANFREIDIKPVAGQIFADVGQDPQAHNLVFENVQAWSRKLEELATACRDSGIVLGTGDLSELALGWCTMFGDHASHYGINSGVPKTLISFMISWTADHVFQAEPDVQAVLRDILDTPISPELLPLQEGRIVQKTEEKVGPYELNDFFLYHFLRFGATPTRIARLAFHAFAGKGYDLMKIKHWLKLFLERFFRSQLKRNCLPDGVKTGLTCLSPRGDWRMPSDAEVTAWIKDLNQVPDMLIT